MHFVSIALVVLIASATCESLSAAEAEVEETRKQLRELSLESLKEENGVPRTGGDSFKDYCNCKSHKECICCADQDIQLPDSQEKFKTKVCTTITFDVPAKILKTKWAVGTLTVLEKDIPFASFDTYCKKLDNYPNVELCTKAEVKESEAKGLTACVKVHLRVLKLVDQYFRLPCVNFKGEKLTVDQSMEDYEPGGVQLNLVALWWKIKEWLHL